MPGGTELKVYSLSSLSNIPSFLILGFMAVLVIGCTILIIGKGWKEGLRATTVILFVEWLFFILCTTIIFRDVRIERDYNLIPFDSYFHYPENSYFIEAAAVNVLNVILFIPLGALLHLGYRDITWKKLLLFGLGISFSIELFQFFFKRGLFETDDLIHNVAGCIIGYGLALVIRCL